MKRNKPDEKEKSIVENGSLNNQDAYNNFISDETEDEIHKEWGGKGVTLEEVYNYFTEAIKRKYKSES